jgi:hypothetical protein
VSDARAVPGATQGLVPALDPLDFPAWSAHVERRAFDAGALGEASPRLHGYRATTWRSHGDTMLALVDRTVGAEQHASCM